MEFYPTVQPPGTAVEEYDTTPYRPVRPTDARDPFTLAFAAAHPAASTLPYASLAVFPTTPGSRGSPPALGAGPPRWSPQLQVQVQVRAEPARKGRRREAYARVATGWTIAIAIAL
jgi:hypothetical protein